ncbi:hypothetical protein QYM36_002525, partial [Artemia franciscana]
TEKAFQKQPTVFLARKAGGKKKSLRYYKNVGLGFKTPRDAIEGTYIDKKCPFTGNVFIRGRILTGIVIKMKMQRTIVIRRDYLHYVKKYNRFEKRHKNMSVHLSPAFNHQPTDEATQTEYKFADDLSLSLLHFLSLKSSQLITLVAELQHQADQVELQLSLEKSCVMCVNFLKKSIDELVPIQTKINYGERQVGYKVGNKVVPVAEMIPEIIVPNLEGCELKPYVSYRAPEVVTNEFKAEDLFNAVYYEKIVKDFKEGKLSENGESLESNEKLTAVQAEIRARQTGSDIFRVEPKIELEMPKLRIGMDKSRK